MPKMIIGGRPQAGNFDDITCEVYNVHDCAIIYRNVHPERLIQPLDWQRRVCKPRDFLRLPHMMFVAVFECGRSHEAGVTTRTNFGANMGKGITGPPKENTLIRKRYGHYHLGETRSKKERLDSFEKKMDAALNEDN